jgi:hypothetical protein
MKWVALFNTLSTSFVTQTKGLFLANNTQKPDKLPTRNNNFSINFFLSLNDFDFLKTTNSGLLLNLTTVNNTFSIPVHFFTNTIPVKNIPQSKLNFFN